MKATRKINNHARIFPLCMEGKVPPTRDAQPRHARRSPHRRTPPRTKVETWPSSRPTSRSRPLRRVVSACWRSWDWYSATGYFRWPKNRTKGWYRILFSALLVTWDVFLYHFLRYFKHCTKLLLCHIFFLARHAEDLPTTPCWINCLRDRILAQC